MAVKTLFPFGKKNEPARRDDDNPFALLRRDMDAVFENFFRGFSMEHFEGRLGTFTPKVDVLESDKEITVSAELPGMDEKEIEVSLTREALTIRGEKKVEKEDKGRDYYRMERSYGSFSRTVPLPEEIDQDKVAAEFKKGVLKVTLPKTAQAVKESKKITVKVE